MTHSHVPSIGLDLLLREATTTDQHETNRHDVKDCQQRHGASARYDRHYVTVIRHERQKRRPMSDCGQDKIGIVLR